MPVPDALGSCLLISITINANLVVLDAVARVLTKATADVDMINLQLAKTKAGEGVSYSGNGGRTVSFEQVHPAARRCCHMCNTNYSCSVCSDGHNSSSTRSGCRCCAAAGR